MSTVMSKNKKSKKSLDVYLKVNKKDTCGLFDGGFKSSQFESKKYKSDKYNNRKNIRDYNDYD